MTPIDPWQSVAQIEQCSSLTGPTWLANCDEFLFSRVRRTEGACCDLTDRQTGFPVRIRESSAVVYIRRFSLVKAGKPISSGSLNPNLELAGKVAFP